MVPQIPDWSNISLVMPEVFLVLGMCAVLLVPFIKRSSHTLPSAAAVVALALALVSAITSFGVMGKSEPQVWLSSMLTIDPFSQFFKILLCLFTLLVVAQWLATAKDQTHAYDTPDFLCLILGAATGMALMSSAHNLLMIFIATESASLPSFALAGWRKRHRVGSESSLKYVLFGAAASAVSLYGMSLIYGTTGTLDLVGIAHSAVEAGGISPLMAVGLLAMFAGFAFKLSAVPLHFWCPDVFEGAPIAVTTFLSVASKGGAICLLLRVLDTFGATAPVGSKMFTGVGVGVAILGAITASWGNLVALHQNNIKRLLAYSSISHAGYMIMAASVILFAHQSSEDGLTSPLVAGSVLFYLTVYLFMNMGAFTVAALVARNNGSEDIRDYAGLSKRNIALSILLLVFLLSLFGMPALGGFMGKVYLMTTMSTLGPAGFVLIVVLGVNTVVSLFYYMKPGYYMFFKDDGKPRQTVAVPMLATVVLAVSVVMVFVTGLLPGAVQDLAVDHARIEKWPSGGKSGQVAEWPSVGEDSMTSNHGANSDLRIASDTSTNDRPTNTGPLVH
ncbi:MAG: NADH-quinone oxidoreductase subunit NuoN [Phycisphaera sp.]|nr:NADH-quinone oxidoreductase subunit NuoN [Phycisphaera sp.]